MAIAVYITITREVVHERVGVIGLLRVRVILMSEIVRAMVVVGTVWL